jgi:hypothetical protein
MENLVKVAPDKEKAASILKMARMTLEMVKTIDATKFPSNIVKEYYEIMKELAVGILLLDGFKAQGEGAHKKLIEYLERNYDELKADEIALMDDLRTMRHRIAYAASLSSPPTWKGGGKT